jgi:hypothetical protein
MYGQHDRTHEANDKNGKTVQRWHNRPLKVNHVRTLCKDPPNEFAQTEKMRSAFYERFAETRQRGESFSSTIEEFIDMGDGNFLPVAGACRSRDPEGFDA